MRPRGMHARTAFDKDAQDDAEPIVMKGSHLNLFVASAFRLA
jgi:hypothetical protein